jgi:hypothetical protein
MSEGKQEFRPDFTKLAEDIENVAASRPWRVPGTSPPEEELGPTRLSAFGHLCWTVAKWIIIAAGIIVGCIVAVVVGTMLPERPPMALPEWAPYLAIYIAVAVVLGRLDRLGRQLEAVSSVIRSDLATTAERKAELLSNWRDGQQEATKEARQSWVFWGVMGGVALLVWFGTWLRHPGL